MLTWEPSGIILSHGACYRKDAATEIARAFGRAGCETEAEQVTSIKPPISLAIAARVFLIAAAAMLCSSTAENEYLLAARDLNEKIANGYAYLDRLPGGAVPQSEVLTAEREAVHDERTLLAYAEKRLISLADHHAITGSSFRDSWAVVPTYADIWVVQQGDRFVVDAVRNGSPAAQQSIAAGDTITHIDGMPAVEAVSIFWGRLGLEVTPERAEYAARVLVAGRRDRDRTLTIRSHAGAIRELVLPSLYEQKQEARPPLSSCTRNGQTVIRFHNSLGDSATIAAFDETLAAVPARHRLVLDLRDTPSGGNTTVARALLGWFVSAPIGYQIHNRPAEERETGIPRQWVEQVLPRRGRYRADLPTVLVGRWTGSMGEGIAIGFAALGARVEGTRMAGLLGSVEDIQVGQTDLLVKLPTERLFSVTGSPRETFVPNALDDNASKSELTRPELAGAHVCEIEPR
jgi:carboxyl-terminal processing protease